MKKILMVMALAMAGALFAQDKSMSLADARGKIADVVKDPASMTAVMKQLSAADQVAFLASVNEAVGNMPGSGDEKAAKFLAVNTAAMKGAKEGNLTALVAEVFATVPPESLTVINESFAANLFNRNADPSKKYSDAQFLEMATNVFAKVQERTASVDSAGVRNTFAALMIIRSSNGSPAELRDTLVSSMSDPTAREIAQTEWISPALGVGQEKSYEPMLGAAGAGEQPNMDYALSVGISSSDPLQPILADLASENGVENPSSSFVSNVAPSKDETYGAADGTASLNGSNGAQGTSTVPRTLDPAAPYNPENKRGSVTPEPVEPDPYAGMSL